MNQVISAASTWHFSLLPEAVSQKMQAAVLPFPLRFKQHNKQHKNLPLQKEFMMQITVDTASVTDLRRVIVSTCGDLMVYMRVKPVEHASKMKFSLCLNKKSIDSVIGNIMRVLPQAEFGRITPMLPA
ncbi:MAG: hypothetical protein ABI171_16920 [Collimonas sp.]|uniref:hypothetical protein n=1 Tax=Collimonas sp. TaxID=1963772 RepID=UPI0032650A1C